MWFGFDLCDSAFSQKSCCCPAVGSLGGEPGDQELEQVVLAVKLLSQLPPMFKDPRSPAQVGTSTAASTTVIDQRHMTSCVKKNV